MELYLLDSGFRRVEVVDDFISAIWTERYDKAGDTELVVPLTKINIKKYPAGIFLSIPESNEVMILESVLRDLDAGTLKCTGRTLTGALANRYLRTSNDSTNQNWVLPKNDEETGAWLGTTTLEMMNRVVSEVCISGGSYTDGYYMGGVNVIPHLALDPPLNDGESRLDRQDWAVPWGTVYDVVSQLATSHDCGFKLYLESATEAGYTLKFLSYMGRDLLNLMGRDKVMFSVKMDTLAHIKELHSLADYKNLVVTYSSGTVQPSRPGFAFVENPYNRGNIWNGTVGAFYQGLDLRRLDIIVDDLSNFAGDPSDLERILDYRARVLLTQHNQRITVDGEVVPNAQMKFGEDYRLGDIVGLQALDDAITPARITEYIRTQDATGLREYPTVVALDSESVAWLS